MSISGSVGRNGLNKRSDVEIVQRLINENIWSLTPLRRLAVDGRIGPATIGAIEEFQRRICKMARPDGRVDPNGQTIRLLKGAGKAPAEPKAPPTAGGGTGTHSVIYSSNLPVAERIASNYTIEVVKLALVDAKMQKAVITSTIRTPQDQARIMYGNASKNLQGQYKLYGDVGDKVLKVFELNRDKPREEVIGLMKDKIEELLKLGQRTSKHCVTRAAYDALNIVDIGVNSTRAASPGTFNLVGFTKALKDLKTDGYIEHFIDETKKTNSCWHIEVKPDKKALPV